MTPSDPKPGARRSTPAVPSTRHTAGGRFPLVVVGSLNMDLVVRVPRIPVAGETLTGRDLTTSPGGKGANQAVAAARMGAPVAMVGQVGTDAHGDALRRALTQDGIDIGHVGTDPEAPTGLALILVDDAGENRIVLSPGANHTLSPAHVDAAGSLVDNAPLVLTQLEIPLPVVLHTIQRASQAGRPVLLNPAPAARLPAHIWPLVDYLVPNETEASILTGILVDDIASAFDAATHLAGWGIKTVVITLGAQGVVVADASGARHHPAPAVDAVDTTAAGDTFIGAFAAGMSERMTLDQAVEFGMSAARIAVSRQGAQISMPRRDEIGASS